MKIICPKCGVELVAGARFCYACGEKIDPENPNPATEMFLNHQAVIQEIAKVIKGKNDIVEKVLMAVYGSGNILLEDHPGTGKTTLAKTLSRVIDLDYRRQQFTPDTMPTDIIGYTYFDKESGETKYMPGVVQCNLLLADEINRTSAKTQSALLEAMEEKNVTIDGETKHLPKPFFVIATQNPNTSMGTQPLPDSQCDRFIAKISMGYPDITNEMEILKERKIKDSTEEVNQVINRDQLAQICEYVDNIHTADELLNYICRLVDASRNDPDIEVGISPRGAIAIKRLACARAFIRGRDYVIPEDVQFVFIDSSNHRITLSDRARMADKTEKQVLQNIMHNIKPAGIVEK